MARPISSNGTSVRVSSRLCFKLAVQADEFQRLACSRCPLDSTSGRHAQGVGCAALLLLLDREMADPFKNVMRSPQVVMATAQVLFQRFWFVTSLKHFGIRVSPHAPSLLWSNR